MKKCLKCNLEYTNDYIFCTKCGRALVEIEEEEPKVVEAEFEQVPQQEVVEPRAEERKEQTVSDEQIERYKKEIEIFRYRRTAMMVSGIILASIFLIATIAFGVLYGMNFAQEIAAAGTSEIEPSYLTSTYMALTYLSALLFDGGLTLLVLGIVPNTIKIKNRERIIEKNRK